jgi:surface antigen
MPPQEQGMNPIRRRSRFAGLVRNTNEDDGSMAYSVSRVTRFGTMALLAVAVGGCAATGSVQPLAFAPAATQKVADSDAILAALNGGILPPAAADGLAGPDRLRALEAEYQALEKAPLGQVVAWKSQARGTAGEVSAGTPYQVGQQNCRQYTHTATIRGVPVKGQGAACRNEDGSWTPLG